MTDFSKEPLLADNPNRFVILPIQYDDICTSRHRPVSGQVSCSFRKFEKILTRFIFLGFERLEWEVEGWWEILHISCSRFLHSFCGIVNENLVEKLFRSLRPDASTACRSPVRTSTARCTACSSTPTDSGQSPPPCQASLWPRRSPPSQWPGRRRWCRGPRGWWLCSLTLPTGSPPPSETFRRKVPVLHV